MIKPAKHRTNVTDPPTESMSTVDILTKATFDPSDQNRNKSSVYPDRSVYRQSAQHLLPLWLKRMGHAPWVSDDYHTDHMRVEHPKEQYLRQASTLGVALHYEDDQYKNEKQYIRECIRTSLIRWQFSLRSDGVPVSPKWRQSLWYGMAAFQVIQLLREFADFQTPQLLKDIELHVRWLLRRLPQAPWLEANTIAAISESAPLIRDPEVLGLARIRLYRLLKRQNDEGWFPERKGVDIGRHSMTIDALARLYRFHDWEELKEPLHHAIRFLTHFVQPGGHAGGCFGTCDSAMLCPYGLELLSLHYPDAAGLSLLSRQHLKNLDRRRLAQWSDNLKIMLGTNIALAAVHAPPTLQSNTQPLSQKKKHIHFSRSGLSIYQTDHYYAIVSGHKGGSLQVNWKKTGEVTEDQGIVVTYPQDVRISGRNDPRNHLQISPTEVSCSGILRRIKPLRIRWNQWVSYFAQRLVVLYHSQKTRSNIHNREHANRRMAAKRFTRVITFGEDWIRIIDKVHSRPRCETIICQSPVHEQQSPLVDHPNSFHRQPPIFIEGGRDITITRFYRDGQLVDQQDSPGVI